MKKKPTKEKTHLLNAPSGDKNRVQNTWNESLFSLLFDKHLLQKSESSHSNNITNKLSKI